MAKIVYKYGKKFFHDSSLPYSKFKQRLSTLKAIHPKLKYYFVPDKKLFHLYVRRWGM